MDYRTLTQDYVIQRVTVDKRTKCWIWQRSINPRTGYGQVGFKPYTAHRLAYLLFVGEPDGEQIRHACHNRKCCNPAHLRDGSAQDNFLDSLPAHQLAWDQRRGVTPKNARPVTVDGVDYPSIDHARKALRVSWKTVAKMTDASPRTGLAF